MSNCLSAEDICIFWENEISEEFGVARFQSANRKDAIDRLGELLESNKIPESEARFLEKRVLHFLVTKDGLKNSGKYKGWVDTVKKEFSLLIQQVYIAKKIVTDSVKPNKNSGLEKLETTKGGTSLMPLGSDMKIYLDNRWGDRLTDRIITETRKVGSVYNLEFLDKSFGDLY